MRRNGWLVAIAAAYVCVWSVNRSVVAVRGGSMAPTLVPGDLLLTVPAVRARLRPGQVVVVRDPEDHDHLVVKRLTWLDGAWAELRGDDPAASTDSRRWGPVPITAIRRIAVRRWPDLRTRLDQASDPVPTIAEA